MKAGIIIIASTVLLAGCTTNFIVSPVNENTPYTERASQSQGNNVFAFPGYWPGPYSVQQRYLPESTVKRTSGGKIKVEVTDKAEFCALCDIECPDADVE